MPTVPRITPRVSTEALPGVRQNPNVSDATFGGGEPLQKTVNAAQGLLNTADKIYQAEKKKADDIAIQDLDLQSSLVELDIEQTIKNMKGQDALSAPDVLKESWKKETDRIKENAKNDTQRAAFDRISNARYVSLYGATQKHVDSEIKAYDDQQTMAYVTTAINQAAINYQDDEKSARSMFQIENALLKKSERSGWSKEQTDAELFKSRSSMHTEKLRRAMAEGNLAWADSYAKKFKKEIDQNGTDELASIRKMVEQKRTETDFSFQNELYLRAQTGEATLDEIDGLLKNGQIKREFHNTLRSRILSTNDDPTLPAQKKTEKLFEILQSFEKINGAVDYENMKIEGPSGSGRLSDIQDFRKLVAKNSRYLNESQERAFYKYTQKDLNDATVGKIGLIKRLKNVLSEAFSRQPGPAAAVSGSIMQQAMETLDPSVPIEKAMETTESLRQKALIATNPNRANYQIGQIITNPQGIRAEVTGYDERGNPTFKAVK